MTANSECYAQGSVTVLVKKFRGLEANTRVNLYNI